MRAQTAAVQGCRPPRYGFDALIGARAGLARTREAGADDLARLVSRLRRGLRATPDNRDSVYLPLCRDYARTAPLLERVVVHVVGPRSPLGWRGLRAAGPARVELAQPRRHGRHQRRVRGVGDDVGELERVVVLVAVPVLVQGGGTPPVAVFARRQASYPPHDRRPPVDRVLLVDRVSALVVGEDEHDVGWGRSRAAVRAGLEPRHPLQRENREERGQEAFEQPVAPSA